MNRAKKLYTAGLKNLGKAPGSLDTKAAKAANDDKEKEPNELEKKLLERKQTIADGTDPLSAPNIAKQK